MPIKIDALSFLPEPRWPESISTDWHQLPSGVHPAVDQYRDGVQEIFSSAMAAISALQDGRPGGSAWVAAMAADRDAVVAGKPPTGSATSRWESAKLISGDPTRWAAASAYCRAATARVAALRAAIPARQVAKDLDARAITLADERRPHLQSAWASASKGARLEAQVAERDAERVSGQIVDAYRVARWATGSAPYDTNDVRVWWVGPHAKPDRGLWFATAYTLGTSGGTVPDPDTLTLPSDFHDPRVSEFVATSASARGADGWA